MGCCVQLRGYFNSQPHEEADRLKFESAPDILYFNSQPHEEADWASPDCTSHSKAFQLTASRRG